ncbi:unnamed protein product, partial [Rotaria sp. Silwood2]
MISRIFLLIAVGILCNFVSWISGHAYFAYPTPRSVYCTNASCTVNGTLGAQGPIWGLPANSTLIVASPISQTTCNGSILVANAPLGNTYDPGFQGKTSASWLTGSTQTLQIFVSETHSPENQTIYPTDGWQIRYRDGTQADSTFSAIPFTYVNVSTMRSVGPAQTIEFQLGQIVSATITVPMNTTTDGIFQFFWRNNEVSGGVMFLSCVDVAIINLSTILAPSTFSIIFASVLTTISATLY